jgi:DNA-directed RNA polymerase subunit omega
VAKLGVIDSKYRFIILAAQRARQLYGGAKPMIAALGKKPVRIAQEEVAAGLVDYELLGDDPISKRPKQTSRRQTKRMKSEVSHFENRFLDSRA